MVRKITDRLLARIRISLSSVVLGTCMLMPIPSPAQAQTIFDVFPGIGEFLGVSSQVSSLPIYEVKERVMSEQEVLLQVCERRGYGESCAKALLGMMWKESLNDAYAVGDQGRALGYFQIHYKMHRVSEECATDLRCSAEWSLSYMESNGYPQAPSYAVQCHNGCNAGNGYAASALRHGARLWNQPVPDPATDALAIAMR